PITVTAGSLITYEIVVDNNAGPSTAQSVDIKDTLPPGVSLVDASIERTGSGPAACGGPVCQVGDMAVGETVTITIVGLVGPSVPDNTLIENTATVFSNTPDPDEENNSDTAQTVVDIEADLNISKDANPDPAVPGETLTYVLTVRNTGPSAAQNVIVTDDLPAGFILTSVSSSQGDCDVLPCNLGTLPVNGSATVTIVGTVSADVTEPLDNAAEVDSDTADPNPDDNTTELETPVDPQADLALDVTSTPTTIAGETVVVTYTVTNEGPSDAAGTVVTATLPPGTTFSGENLPPGWTAVDNGDGTVTITAPGPIPPGTTIDLPIIVDVDPDLPNGLSLEFTGIVTSETPDPVISNNFDNADTSILTLAELRLTKETIPDPLVAGELVTYTILVENLGPSISRQVQVIDVLPNEVSFVSTTTTQGTCAGTLCLLNDIPPNQSVTITLVGRIDSSTPDDTILTNSATVNSQTLEPGLEPNNDSVSNFVDALASLRIEKRDLFDPVAPDENLIYFIVVTNTGPSDAENLVVTDQLPPEVTYVSNTDSCVETLPGVLTCSLGTLGAGETTNFLVSTLVSADVVSGTELLNFVELTSSTHLVDSILEDTEPTLVQQRFGSPADLAVEKSSSDNPVVAGELLTYTLTVINYGPGTAVDVELVDALPDGVTLIRATPSQGQCNGATCLLDTMPFNGSPSIATIEMVVRVNADVPEDTTLTNNAFVQSGNLDPNPDNNTTVDIVGVVAWADLTVIKKDTVDPVTAGKILTYTIEVINLGPSDAVNVIVTDDLPPGTTFVGGTYCSDLGGGRIECLVGDLAAGESRELLLAVHVPPDATSQLLNRVDVHSDTYDPVHDNNDDDEFTGVRSKADVSIIKHVDKQTAKAGEEVVYTLVVRNEGHSVAENVTVRDVLPGEVTFKNASPPPFSGPFPLVWVLGDLNPGDTVNIEIVVEANSDIANSALVHNNAEVSSTTFDPDLSNNQDDAVFQTVRQSDVEVRKRALSDPVVIGEELSYLIEVHNLGPSEASDVDVKDVLPPGLSLVSLETSKGVCVGQICQLDSVAVSETVTIDARVRVDQDATHNSELCNTAAVFQDTEDPVKNNNRDDECITVQRLSDLKLEKLVDRQEANKGDHLNFMLKITNKGPSDAVNLVVVDTLSSGLSFESSDGNCTPGAGNTVICTVPFLAVGDSTTIELTAEVTSEGGVFERNHAVVDSEGLQDPTPGDNEDEVDVYIRPAPQNPIYLPIIIMPGGVCETGRVQVTVWGTFYSFPLTPDENVKTIRPLNWNSTTTFRIVNYDGAVVWTQYQPTYFKQQGGYEFVYPGGHAGEVFWLTVQTECGTIIIATPVDDPTPTPVPLAINYHIDIPLILNS
ncbi:MAG: DUF11 domain-containing protein, partial [Chloroflexi bacterium]|nr:DUF11 domain-containing protein [Chloroflexota bacterium]